MKQDKIIYSFSVTKAIFFALPLLVGSCASRDNDAREAVTHMVGKEVTIPYDYFTCAGKPIVFDRDDYEFKIVNLVDSTGCTRCRMKLDMWNMYMSRLEAMGADATLLTIVQTNDEEEIRAYAESVVFNYPVLIDSLNRFGEMDRTSSDPRFQTLLLDADDRVIAVGNPMLLPKIATLYRNIILGDSIRVSDHDMPVTADMLSRNVGVTYPGTPSVTLFYITNNTGDDITVDTIVTSCDCTAASLKQPSIPASSIATLSVAVTPDSVTGPFQRQLQVYFKDNPTPLTLQITGTNNHKNVYMQ